MPLKTELAFFERNRAAWLNQHKDKHVLIKGEELLGLYDTPLAAFDAGLKKLGPESSMFIKQVLAEDPVIVIMPVSYAFARS